MAGYDPQKARGRHEIPADEPAPVDGLLGPAPEVEGEGRGPMLAHEAGRPMVRQVLPVPPVVPAASAEAPPAAVTEPDPEPEPAEPEAVAPKTVAPSFTPAAPAPLSSSRVRIVAGLAAVIALVLLVIWRRRHR